MSRVHLPDKRKQINTKKNKSQFSSIKKRRCSFSGTQSFKGYPVPPTYTAAKKEKKKSPVITKHGSPSLTDTILV